jgi:hypothetical protein
MSASRDILGTGFFYALIGGFFLAFFVMGIVNLGDCPGETATALACRAAQKRTAIAFPLIYVAVTTIAVLRHRKGREGASQLALFAGLIAAAVALLVNGFAR